MKKLLLQGRPVFLSLAVLAAFTSSVAAQDSCKLTAIGVGTVATIRDGRSLFLGDGRELRLAGIEVTDNSRSVLQSLVEGRELRLMQLGPERDRYGRIVALAYIGDSQKSVQQSMLEQGQARVSARVGDKPCADILLNAERTARVSRLGLWADPNFAPLRPENIDRIAAARGQFTRWKARFCRCGKAAPRYI